jgi:hypothetical protein
MQPFRFLLYCLSSVAGVVGLVVGGAPVIGYVVQRLSGSYTTNYEELFPCAVIFFLSLILLILVHLGFRLAGAFDVSLTKKAEASDLAKKPEV